MSDRTTLKTDVTETEIEGMMLGGYCEGAIVGVTGRYKLECADGEVWRLKTREDELVGVLNPTNCVVGSEIRRQLRHLIDNWEQNHTYESASVSESRS